MRSRDQLSLGISRLTLTMFFKVGGDLCIEMAVDWEELNGSWDELLSNFKECLSAEETADVLSLYDWTVNWPGKLLDCSRDIAHEMTPN